MRARSFTPLLLAALLLLHTLWARQTGRYDPNSHAYGANWPGDVARTLLAGMGEVVLWTLIMRPWSYQHSWGRAAAASVLFLIWGCVTLFLCLHCGTVTGGRGVWLLVIGIGSGIAGVISFIRRAPASPNAAV